MQDTCDSFSTLNFPRLQDSEMLITQSVLVAIIQISRDIYSRRNVINIVITVICYVRTAA